MVKLSLDFPGYCWETNMGYPTEKHRDGIRELGITPLHRKSFTLLPTQLELFED
jgi:ribonuclease HII